MGWANALATVMSSIFRQTDDPQFLVSNLMGITDGNGFYHKGEYIPSLPSMFGFVLNKELKGYSNAIQKVKPETLKSKNIQCTSCHSYNTSKSGGCFVCYDCGFSTC